MSEISKRITFDELGVLVDSFKHENAELKTKLKAANELIDLLMRVGEFYETGVKAYQKFGYTQLVFLDEQSNKARANQDKINELLKKVRG